MATHLTVLLHEAIEGLAIKSDGCYVDGTFGRGGHSELLLQSLGAEGRLLVIDKDPAAIAVAQQLAANDSRVSWRQGGFAQLADYVEELGWQGQVDGVLLDLGVSSPQLDEHERGFSFLRDGPLDMRMDNESGPSVAQWIAKVDEAELVSVLFEYGEERFARRIARAIVERREQQPFLRTEDLAKVVAQAHPKWVPHKHPATLTFQALRIAINNELKELEVLLESVIDVLKVGGRLVVISFHSLEDRMVKQFIRKQARGGDIPKGLPITQAELNIRLKSVGKAIKPSADEQDQNRRARSAVMRIAQRAA